MFSLHAKATDSFILSGPQTMTPTEDPWVSLENVANISAYEHVKLCTALLNFVSLSQEDTEIK